MNESYKAAGVDVHAGYKAVELMKQHVKKTHIDGVMSDIGGFGGLFELGTGYKNPVLVSGTDGVGTKLKIAFVLDKHDTVGQDCVAMCVNDIACSGAKPLFFLDYIALGKNVPEKVADIVKGVADGCLQAGCALIGGETAEMPGFYPEDEYDLAGFSVGIVDKEKILNGDDIEAGDVLIGVPSSGIHSNGYSLVRKIFGLSDDASYGVLSKQYDELSGTLGETLLTPTKIYVKTIQSLLSAGIHVKALSHITGGGFIENIPRMLKKTQTARIYTEKVPVLPIFDILAKEGGIPKEDMYNTFNMGIGLMMAVSPSEVDAVLKTLQLGGETGYILGEVTYSGGGVDLV